MKQGAAGTCRILPKRNTESEAFRASAEMRSSRSAGHERLPCARGAVEEHALRALDAQGGEHAGIQKREPISPWIPEVLQDTWHGHFRSHVFHP